MSQSSSGRVRERDIWKRGRGQTEGKEKHMGQKGDKVIKEELRHIRRGGEMDGCEAREARGDGPRVNVTGRAVDRKWVSYT